MPSGVYKRTDAHKISIGNSARGRHWKLSEETKRRMSLAKKGKSSHWKGKKRSPWPMERKILLSKIKRGVSNSSRGIKRPAQSGRNHYKWIENRSLIVGRQNRNNPEYKQWRIKVWARDNFKCKILNNDCDGRIEAHHILSWSTYPELRYNINNGITLCHAHHPRKRAEEKLLIPDFQRLVGVSIV